MSKNKAQKNKKKTFTLSQNILSKTTGLIKKYKTNELEVEVLKGIDLNIYKGEVLAIIGPSGCGKTTLLNCLSGIDGFDKGDILFDGVNLEDLTEKKRTELRASRMGFIFQNFNLIPVLSALENVELPLLLTGKSTKEARKRAEELLNQVGLAHRLNNKPNQLSGGEKQRVAIARAMANTPEIIWADEPTGNLDTQTSNEIMELILETNKTQKTTFVIITHDLNIATKADRIIRMDSGKIVNN